MTFEDQLAALRPRLFRYAMGLSHSDTDEADDLVQAVTERALARRHQFMTDLTYEGLRAWCFTIMHNMHATLIRRTHARAAPMPWPVNEDGDLLADIPDAPTVAPDAPSKILLDQVRQAIARLLPEQQQVLNLVVYNGLRYEEAARITGAPHDTIRSRLGRARDRLRAQFPD